MSYLALARRYRPGDFENILSQQHVTVTLRNAVKSGRISHAYLFAGPRGTGKTTTARVLAKALNCAKGPTPDPCGVCTSCKEITVGSSPDVFEIDAASNRGIDDIRELRENVRYSPIGGRYKIYIIDEVHRLTKEAFDALLKTLEEPPAHVIFIFATTDPQALPATILSRTQRYDFKRIPVTALSEAINSIATKEGINIEPGAALLVAKKADGSLRDALSLLDQLSSFSDGPIGAEQTAEILGLVKTEFLAQIASAVIKRDPRAALDLFGQFTKSGGDPQEFADALSGYFRILMLVKNGINDIELLELDGADMETAKEIISDVDIVDLLRYFTILADYRVAVRSGQDPVYSLEATLLKMAAMDHAVSIQSLLSKLPDTPVSKVSPAPAKSAARHSTRTEMMPDPGPIYYAEQNLQPPRTAPTSEPVLFDGPLTFENLSANWDRFCSQVKKSKMSTWAYLNLCRPAGFANDTLALTIDSANKIQLQELLRPDIRRFLEDSLKDYFKCNIRLSITPGDNIPKSNSGNFLKIDPDKVFENAPDAKELFDSLGGEMIGP
jgi:DNA polymerase-3 subunit gamma/tau